ncbi:hypothetical protein BraRD5C2_40170 [Bradyrhizobium sp. RD5-C2]|nr:hypothetical protein BraRD5C2_40170 [Bradyrhizobium sp. RD5-C2]
MRLGGRQRTLYSSPSTIPHVAFGAVAYDLDRGLTGWAVKRGNGLATLPNTLITTRCLVSASDTATASPRTIYVSPKTVEERANGRYLS